MLLSIANSINPTPIWLTILITLGIGLVSGLISGVFLVPYLKKKKEELRVKRFKNQNGFNGDESIDNYFTTVIESEALEIVAFQFGLRPDLPIVDVLYLEILKKWMKEGKIAEIVIFPTIDKSINKQTEHEFEEFKSNIKRVFHQFDNQVDIVDPFRETELTSQEMVAPVFIDTLHYLGSEEFFETVSKISKYNIQGVQDFNRFHKKDKSILTLLTHIFKAWEVKEYILNRIESSEKEKMKVGFLFWEVEYDKWGIYDRASQDDRISEVGLIMGKTILGKDKKPIPVFTSDSIGVFESKDMILQKISRYNSEGVKKMTEVVYAIIRSNYNYNSENVLLEAESKIHSINTSNKVFGDVYREVEATMTDRKKVLFSLILFLRSKYEA